VISVLAGFGGLGLSIEGPSKADIQCEDNPDGTCQVKYTPTEPGNYIVNIKFADEHIRGLTATLRLLFEKTYETRQQNAKNSRFMDLAFKAYAER